MTTYSITLDDVDLALLPMRSYNSYSNLLKKEYFQFQVLKESVPEVSSEHSSMVTYKCHICAIDVPAAFASEHAASVKHRANARIASVAAQRTRALISAIPPPVTEMPNARFCANCVTIVDDDHEKAKEHRVAVMHDNLLWELTKAYVGNDDDDNNISEAGDLQNYYSKKYNSDVKHYETAKKNYTEIPHVTEKIQTTKQITLETDKKGVQNEQVAGISTAAITDKRLDHKDKETNKEDTTINKNEDIPNGNVLHSASRWVKLPIPKDVTENRTTQNGLANVIGNNQSKAKHTKEDYVNELRKFMDTNNPFEIKEACNKIQIKTNDVTVNVYSDHFHSYHRMNYNGKIECVLCDCTFNIKDAEAHKYNLNHMTSIAKIGNDADFLREINELYSHCILCNHKIKNVNLAAHKQSQHHVVRKTNNTKTMRREAKEAEESSNAEKNETAEDKSKITDNEIDNPYKEFRGALWCTVCDCQVPRDMTNRKDHVKGLRHKQNMK